MKSSGQAQMQKWVTIRFLHSPIAAVSADLLCLGTIEYFLLLGGTPFGDYLPSLRFADGLVSVVVIAAYVRAVVVHNDLVDRIVLVAAALMAASGAFSVLPRASLDPAITGIALAGAFYLLRRRVRRAGFMNLLMFMLAVTGLVLAAAFALAWGSHLLEWWVASGGLPPPLRMDLTSGPFGHQHNVVTLLLMLIPAAFYGRGWVSRMLRFLTTPLVVAILVVDGSRTLWAAALAAALVAFALRRSGRLPRLHPGILIATGLTSLVVLVLAVLTGAFVPLLSRLLTLTSLDARLSLWSASLGQWLAHPFTGTGPGTYPWVLQFGSYFDTNAWTARHPDNAIVQLLLELGLLGVAAVALLAVATVVGARRARRVDSRAVVGLGVFVLAGIGMNPSDHNFLIVLAIIWAAVLTQPVSAPRLEAPEKPLTSSVGRRWRRLAIGVGLASLLLSFASTSLGSFAYEAAATAEMRGDLPGADASLSQAIGLDPSMALYWRERGAVRLLSGNPAEAASDLARAAVLNPNDDATWRSLALAHLRSNDGPAAIADARIALGLRRSFWINEMLFVAVNPAPSDETTVLVTQMVEVQPQLLGLQEFRRLLAPTGHSADVLRLALTWWQGGKPSLAPLLYQPAWMAGLAGQPALITQGAGDTALLQSDRALAAALECKLAEAGPILLRAEQSEYQNATYWTDRSVVEGLTSRPNDQALRLGSLLSIGFDIRASGGPFFTDPLSGSTQDTVGYDRPYIGHPPVISLPGPDEAMHLWLTAPARALAVARGSGCK